ncbi:MAG: hypothetical protein ACFBSC_12755 [Microcoleaceae cyanobacterium]
MLEQSVRNARDQGKIPDSPPKNIAAECSGLKPLILDHYDLLKSNPQLADRIDPILAGEKIEPIDK